MNKYHDALKGNNRVIKVYTAASITSGDRGYVESYQRVNNILNILGCDVLCSHVSKAISYEHDTMPIDVYKRNISWINHSNCMIAEVSVPSLGVGYEMAYALCNSIPVLAIYSTRVKLSKMIIGIDDHKFTCMEYNNINEIDSMIINYMTLLCDKSK